jgi:SnoaL-like protein
MAARAAVEENAMTHNRSHKMSLKLPAPVAAYLAAEKAKNADMLASCFADDALVHDEGRDHRGRDAIRSWKREADAKSQYVLEPLDASLSGKAVKLRARLTGNFPGSPVELDFTFALANDKIASLDIR